MDPLTDAGTAPDDASSLPARGRLHTNAEALRGHVPELFGEAAEHRGAASSSSVAQAGWSTETTSSPPANELGLHLAGDLRADDLLPAARDTTEHESVFHAPLVQQLVQGVADRYRSRRPALSCDS